MAAGLFPLFVSTSYIGLTSLIAFWLRKFLDSALKSSSLGKLLLQEVIAAGELCACCFELIIGKSNTIINIRNFLNKALIPSLIPLLWTESLLNCAKVKVKTTNHLYFLTLMVITFTTFFVFILHN